jgi:hypothetical protein
MGAIWTTKCSLGDVFTLRGIYWSTQFVLTAENDPYASGHLHWSRDSLRAPSPGWLAHTHGSSVKWNSPNGIRIGDGTCIGSEGAFGFLRLFGGGRGLASSRMRKVPIQRGWPPATPIALKRKGRGWDWTYRSGPARVSKSAEIPTSAGTLVRLEQSWSKWHKIACRGGASSNELEKDIRGSFRPAKSYKELINEQNVHIIIVYSCIGAVPIASL